MFDVEGFVQKCVAASDHPDAPRRIAEILGGLVSQPDAIAEAIRKRQAGKSPPPMADVFINSDKLTIYHVAFPSNLFGVPHDHAGWAVIGVYRGTEEFNVYREEEGKLVRQDRHVMRAPAVETLPPDLIHDIENSGGQASGSIHVYGNRHFDMPGRRIWRDGSDTPEPFTLERSFDYGMERTKRIRAERGINDPLPDLPSPDDVSRPGN